MNMFKSNGGFTLVELIVVIAILAILAGVAVPAYSGYIARANDAAIISELSALQTAAQSVCVMDGTTVAKIVVSTEGEIAIYSDLDAENAVAAAGDGNDLTDFYTAGDLKGLIAKNSEYKGVGCTWTSAGWAKTTTDAGDGE